MGNMKSKVDVIIPVCHPGKKLFKVLDMLAEQTVIPEKVYLLNVEDGDEESSCEELQKQIYRYFGKHKLFGHKLPMQLEIIPVEEEDYNPGATRNLGAKHSSSPFLLFMKQDAVPADSKMIEELLWDMESGAGVAYARHITGPSAGILKTYSTMYDYPSKSYVRVAEDVKKYGIRAYRCSNACAMYRRDCFLEQGGFKKWVIAEEDILFAAHLLQNGGKVAYCAEAKVYYKESSDWMSQLRRKFDQGVVHAEYTKLFYSSGTREDAVGYGKKVLSYLINQKYYLEILDFFGENLYKFVGYLLGRNYRLLKKEWIQALTANKSYWSKN